MSRIHYILLAAVVSFIYGIGFLNGYLLFVGLNR